MELVVCPKDQEIVPRKDPKIRPEKLEEPLHFNRNHVVLGTTSYQRPSANEMSCTSIHLLQGVNIINISLIFYVYYNICGLI